MKPRFCGLCGHILNQEEDTTCKKCKRNPLRSVISTYGREVDQLRQEIKDIDHDHREDGCGVCAALEEASLRELRRLKKHLRL